MKPTAAGGPSTSFVLSVRRSKSPAYLFGYSTSSAPCAKDSRLARTPGTPGPLSGPPVHRHRSIISLKFPALKADDHFGTSSTRLIPTGNTNELKQHNERCSNRNFFRAEFRVD